MALELSDAQLLAMMRRFEDHFVERKTANDKKDWLKTIVAFANSAPAGSTAILFIGVTDAGEIEGQTNLDSLRTNLTSQVRLSSADCRKPLKHPNRNSRN